MVARRLGKKYGGPWYHEFAIRTKFEHGVSSQFSSLVTKDVRMGKKIWREYKLTIRVPTYPSRVVTIKFLPNRLISPKVEVDGPTESLHRYDDGSLCMWYPWDPKKSRWVFDDGLLHLLILAQAHLFREAWWRDTDEWLGPEVLHEQINHNDQHCTSNKSNV